MQWKTWHDQHIHTRLQTVVTCSFPKHLNVIVQILGRNSRQHSSSWQFPPSVRLCVCSLPSASTQSRICRSDRRTWEWRRCSSGWTPSGQVTGWTLPQGTSGSSACRRECVFLCRQMGPKLPLTEGVLGYSPLLPKPGKQQNPKEANSHKNSCSLSNFLSSLWFFFYHFSTVERGIKLVQRIIWHVKFVHQTKPRFWRKSDVSCPSLISHIDRLSIQIPAVV